MSVTHIINVLGYDNSQNLLFNKGYNAERLGYHTSRILKELNPDAVYLLDNKPFIVFYDNPPLENKKNLFKKIWNAQIPIAIFDSESLIEIFNGSSLSENNQQLELITKGSLSSEKIKDFSYWNISNPLFWNKYDADFSHTKLDQIMLENLKYIMQRLKQRPCASFANILILRLIFIRFLIDRGVDINYKGFSSDKEHSQKYLLQLMESKKKLYDFFAYLKSTFNGNLFEDYEEKNEYELLDNETLKLLKDFMSGTIDLEKSQPSLFPLYDFNIIPIELVSSIYERFLGEERQKVDSAFYTPAYLVDYILQQQLKPFLVKHDTCKILDPSCGSGIFLVQSLRCIIEKNLQQGSFINDDKKLISLIKDNIFGIDKNQEAIDVAIFSLYITMLDYKDPKTLKNIKLPNLKEFNFKNCDFFSEQVDEFLFGKKFEFIIGNPPWGKVDDGLHISYCKKNKLPHLNNEISRSFIERTKDFASDGCICCLIVTSKLFYNTKTPAKLFRNWLLCHAKIIKFIELAAVRTLIFNKANCPASIIFYHFNDSAKENLKHKINHLVLKPNIYFKLFNIIAIENHDNKYVEQQYLLDYDWLWKVLVYGTSYDFGIIKALKDNYLTIKDVIKKYQFVSGKGIQDHLGDAQDASHLIGMKIIDSTHDISAFNVTTKFAEIFQKRNIHRVRNPKLFEPPYVLIKKGFDTQTYKLRSVYSEEKFLYRDAITGIKGKLTDKTVLLSLVGFINSSLYAYLNLMLGGSTGIEREQVFLSDVFDFPINIDNHIAEITNVIQEHLHDNKSNIEFLDQEILKNVNLANNEFIDYAINIQIPQLKGNLKIYYPADDNELIKYSRVIVDYFNGILKDNKQYLSAKIYKDICHHFNVIRFYITMDDSSTISFEENINKEQFNLLNHFRFSKINDYFYNIKDLINFEKDSFYIMKNNSKKNWHPALAIRDIDDILKEIFKC